MNKLIRWFCNLSENLCKDKKDCSKSGDGTQKLVFEYTDSFGYKTRVVKYFDEWDGTQFQTLLRETTYAMLACGFMQDTIDEYIDFGD